MSASRYSWHRFREVLREHAGGSVEARGLRIRRIENETNRQGNTQFLAKGIATVAAVVPWDEVKLIDVGLEQYNDADYVIVAKSTLGKALVILEIDNRGHAGGGIYSPAVEKQKNDGNFNAGNGFDKVLFLRVNPSGQYTTSEGEASLEKKARFASGS